MTRASVGILLGAILVLSGCTIPVEDTSEDPPNTQTFCEKASLTASTTIQKTTCSPAF